MSINLGMLALVLVLYQIILNYFLKLSKDTYSLKEALRNLSDCFFTQQGHGIGETGSIFYRQRCAHLSVSSEVWVASMEWCLSSYLGAEVTSSLHSVAAMYRHP